MADLNKSNLKEAGEALLEAMEFFAFEVERAERQPDASMDIRRFNAYHLASLQGNGTGDRKWLADNLLADAVRELIADQPADEEFLVEPPFGFDSWARANGL